MILGETYLNILQLEGYNGKRFINWWLKNPTKLTLEGKKKLAWTAKARAVYLLAIALWIAALLVRWEVGLLSVLVWWVWLLLALATLSPIEGWVTERIKQRTRNKIDTLKAGGLIVIAISGSYGKTSVKEYLYQCLRKKMRVVRTPESFNTVLGIAKVVDMELWEDTKIFICEMGTYRRGETMELCEMVDPDYAILSGLNEQHLERFGSLENEILAESESVNYVLKKRGKVVANFGNEHVKTWWGGIKGVEGYGEGIYETPMEQNVEGAKKMARLLGVEEKDLPRSFMPPSHRLSLIKRGEMTIIDDAFSSNSDGFKAAIGYMQKFDGWKVVVTPGIIELGRETERIHSELGGIMKGRVDQLILVGRNERTEKLEEGFGTGEYIEKVGEALGKVKEKKAVVLFENDLPDNY